MIDKRMVGEFYHQTTKLTCLIFMLLILASCSSNKKYPTPWTTIIKITTGNFR